MDEPLSATNPYNRNAVRGYIGNTGYSAISASDLLSSVKQAALQNQYISLFGYAFLPTMRDYSNISGAITFPLR